MKDKKTVDFKAFINEIIIDDQNVNKLLFEACLNDK
jgi:hypothetical protein